jgi:hypothetical protein
MLPSGMGGLALTERARRYRSRPAEWTAIEIMLRYWARVTAWRRAGLRLQPESFAAGHIPNAGAVLEPQE